MCQKIIICFENEDDCTHVLETTLHKKDFIKHFTRHGINITISQAPQPKEINWENINLEESNRRKRRIISEVIFVVVLGVITTGIYFLFSLTVDTILSSRGPRATFFILSYLVGIIVFNKFIFSYLVHALVDF